MRVLGLWVQVRVLGFQGLFSCDVFFSALLVDHHRDPNTNEGLLLNEGVWGAENPKP